MKDCNCVRLILTLCALYLGDSIHEIAITPIAVHLFVCLFRVFRPTREFFTHSETSSLPAKGCKFCPMLGTYGH